MVNSPHVIAAYGGCAIGGDNAKESKFPLTLSDNSVQFGGAETLTVRLLMTACSYNPPVEAVKYR
jgi:hypothetical protein